MKIKTKVRGGGRLCGDIFIWIDRSSTTVKTTEEIAMKIKTKVRAGGDRGCGGGGGGNNPDVIFIWTTERSDNPQRYRGACYEDQDQGSWRWPQLRRRQNLYLISER